MSYNTLEDIFKDKSTEPFKIELTDIEDIMFFTRTLEGLCEKYGVHKNNSKRIAAGLQNNRYSPLVAGSPRRSRQMNLIRVISSNNCELDIGYTGFPVDNPWCVIDKHGTVVKLID